jgi:hypothetical protein
VGQTVGKPHRSDDDVEPLRVRLAPGDVHRESHVLGGVQGGDEVVGLEHEAHLVPAELGEALLAQRRQVGLTDVDLP